MIAIVLEPRQSRVPLVALIDDDDLCGTLVTTKDGFDGRGEERRPIA